MAIVVTMLILCDFCDKPVERERVAQHAGLASQIAASWLVDSRAQGWHFSTQTACPACFAKQSTKEALGLMASRPVAEAMPESSQRIKGMMRLLDDVLKAPLQPLPSRKERVN